MKEGLLCLLFSFILCVHANYYAAMVGPSSPTVLYEIDENTGNASALLTLDGGAQISYPVSFATNNKKNILYMAVSVNAGGAMILFYDAVQKIVLKNFTIIETWSVVPSALFYEEADNILYFADQTCLWYAIDASTGGYKTLWGGDCILGILGKPYFSPTLIWYGYMVCEVCSMITVVANPKENITNTIDSNLPYLWIIPVNDTLLLAEQGVIMNVTWDALTPSYSPIVKDAFFYHGIYNPRKNVIVGDTGPTDYMMVDITTKSITHLQISHTGAANLAPLAWLDV